MPLPPRRGVENDQTHQTHRNRGGCSGRTTACHTGHIAHILSAKWGTCHFFTYDRQKRKMREETTNDKLPFVPKSIQTHPCALLNFLSFSLAVCVITGSYPTKQREEQRNIEGKKKEVQETKNFVSIQGRALLGGYGWVLFSWALTRDLKKPSFPLPAKNIRKQALSKVPQKGGMGDPNQSQRMGSDHTLQNKGRSKEILRGRKKKYRKPKISFRFKVELCWTPNKVVIKKERV